MILGNGCIAAVEAMVPATEGEVIWNPVFELLDI